MKGYKEGEKIKLWFSDIETIYYKNNNIVKHVPIMIGLAKDNSYWDFLIDTSIENIEESANIMLERWVLTLIQLASSKELNIIYFHNLSSFDGYFIAKALKTYNTDILIRDNKFYSINFSIKRKRFKIIDSYLVIHTNLKAACEMYNNNYYKTEYEFKSDDHTIESIKDLNWNKLSMLRSYMKNDVKCLEELVNRFDEIFYNLFNVHIYSKLTLSSLSLHIFITKYLDQNINMSSLTCNVDKFIRQSYIGGMSNVIIPYGLNIVELDINSMYPYVMKSKEYGFGENEWIYNIEDLESLCNQYKGFVMVNIKTEGYIKYPPIPYRGSKNTKLLQPLGSWSGIYYTEELLNVLKYYPKYYKITPIKAVIFKNKGYIYKEYVDTLYNLRLHYKKLKQTGRAQIIKLMLNSTYGRLGIRPTFNYFKISDNETIKKIINDEHHIKEVTSIDDDYSSIIYVKESGEVQYNSQLKKLNSRVDQAAAITAESRILYNKILRLLGDSNVYYGDTDSVFINEKDLFKLSEMLDQDEIGKLKIERYWEECIFLSSKSYILRSKEDEYKIRLKGIKRSDIDMTDKELFKFMKSFLNENNQEILQVNTERGFTKSLSKLEITFKKMLIDVTLKYDKRDKIYKNGLWVDTKPQIINDESINNVTNINILSKTKRRIINWINKYINIGK